MADLLITASRSLRRGSVALVALAMTAAACSEAPPVAVERSIRIPPTSEVADAADVPENEARLDDIGLDDDVLDSLDELDRSEPLPGIGEPVDERADEPEQEEPAEEEPAEEEPELIGDGRPQIDDVVWTVPADNDRWDLDRDGYADTVAPNPWQIIDALLPPGDELGDPWDSSYRSTSIVGGGSVVPHADTDCDDFDVLTGLNSEYHGTQTWEGEGETISAFVVALDDSIQAAGLAAMLGDLSTTCPTIGPDPQVTPFEPFDALPLTTAHDGLDSVRLQFANGTSTRLVARSHGALLHVVAFANWIEATPTASASVDFATVVDVVVETTPGAPPAVTPHSNRLAAALPTGDVLGLQWDEPRAHDSSYDTDASRSTCAARGAFGAAEDQLEVLVESTYEFGTDVYAVVTLGEFDSATAASDTMTDMTQLAACPSPAGFDVSILDNTVDIDARGSALVPFTFDDDSLGEAVMNGAVLTVGPYVAMIFVLGFSDSVDSDATSADSATLQRQLQLLVDHTVDGLEAMS